MEPSDMPREISKDAETPSPADHAERLLYLKNKINSEGIFRVPENSKELPSIKGAGFYSWQFYLRSVLLDPVSLKVIADDFWSRFSAVFASKPFQIAGVEAAAVPILTAIILGGAERGLTVNAFTVRKERKEYGRRNLIEGKPNNLPVMFIDDLTSAEHKAFWHAIHAFSSHNLSLFEFGYVLVRKQNSHSTPYIGTSIGLVKIESLFTLDDFVLSMEDYLLHVARESKA